ncbi:class I mannose-6-phosphate isomerase [Hymenobacter sp. BT186]|uniref:Class I mannose-6-phosphate isomerase n=1 Tax=Hymenobacter telluris TaxID=2816474 RepID=A0A939JAX6_9BACT|nr:class I mannose-6-phosphate isomerase [Hymenobacter telluris]MBO0356710.1 class I mannose-6-phosphate isomerase [Hymenobacter telluris]MBW3372735.1 class I mannose-6-phosphate isomerase [Hymenobacter norwichensis]
MRASNYDKFPFVPVTADNDACQVGWSAIAGALRAALATRPAAAGRPRVLAVECYPGTDLRQLQHELTQALQPARCLVADDLYYSATEIDRLVAGPLTDDPVFGRFNGLTVADFFNPQRLQATQAALATDAGRLVILIGTGATLVCPTPTLVVYADLARWEIQLRQRRGEIANLGTNNFREKASLKYKRAFFVDWRAADRLKKQVLPRADFLLDTNDPATPKLVSGTDLRAGLAAAVRRPFRVVPFFDPGPWGGQWMREVCDLPDGPPNYAWCFDCVPEENSLLLGFGAARVEVPSLDLVFAHPRELLGEAVHGRFGTEFPIRFDFLDTMGGGNLSLQVHPLTEYAQDKFGLTYTQDESYYLLAAEPGAVVYLGLQENADFPAMLADLQRAQHDPAAPFPADRYINAFPARAHDHFLIPAGTIHCSGAGSMVLEISATPYIFTFKLWDWERLGLDGQPRPIHLAHGAANIQPDRTTSWVTAQLVNQVTPVASGPDWREERTGLHEREFIETRRHWFTGTVPHNTHGGVNVLNLVQGTEAVVESPTGAFEPFVVHYAETFIVPAAVGDYTIRPHGPAVGTECATLKAYVRTQP